MLSLKEARKENEGDSNAAAKVPAGASPSGIKYGEQPPQQEMKKLDTPAEKSTTRSCLENTPVRHCAYVNES